MSIVVLVYAAGALLMALLTEGSPFERITLAVLWPLGPLAFAATVTILLLVAAVAFPVFGALVAAAAVVWWLAG